MEINFDTIHKAKKKKMTKPTFFNKTMSDNFKENKQASTSYENRSNSNNFQLNTKRKTKLFMLTEM